MRDNPACLECGKPFPDDARVDRMYCDRRCNNRRYKKIRSGKVIPLPAVDPVARLAQMTPQQLGWVTAIVEGEGCISTHVAEKIDNLYVHALVKVGMVDEDVIRRLADWTGLGRVTGPHLPPAREKAGHQAQWHWNVNKHEHVEALVSAMWPLLGERRRQQVTRMRQRMTERTLKRAC